MKAFGVRLAFGAVTILCGAYAAALASKEQPGDGGVAVQRQSPAPMAQPIAGMTSESSLWDTAAIDDGNAEVTSLPAVPASWIRDESQPTDASPAPVQLVSHDEPFALPESTDAASGGGGGPAFDLPPMPGGFGGDPAISNPTIQDEAAGRNDLPVLPAMSVPSSEVPPYGQTPSNSVANGSVGYPAAMPEDLAVTDGQNIGGYPDAEPSREPSLMDSPPEATMPAARPAAQMPVLNLSSHADRLPSSAEMATPATNTLRGGGGTSSNLVPAPGAEPFTAAPSLSGYPAAGTSPSPRGFEEPTLPATVQSPLDRGASPSNTRSTMPRPAMARPAAIAADNGSMEVDPNQIFNAPGDPRLDGIQSPSIVIQKRAPAEVKVGQAAPFVLQVQNIGSAEAMDVKIHDRIPAGMRMVDATPAPMQQGDLLLWELGTMPAGDERTVTVQLIPETEGELGSVARVTFESAASVRTIATRPQLKLVQHAPTQVLVGQQVEIELEVSNPGTGVASAVTLQEDVPENFQHPRGRQLDNLLGDIAPGELRRQMLRMQAVEPGMVQNLVRLTSQDGLVVEDVVRIEVIAPNLTLAVNGPSRRFLERQATYNVDIANAGTADATNVEIAVQLDRGFQFVRTENQGVYDASRHTVYWSLASLPAGQSGSIPVTLLPVTQGNLAMRADAKSDLDSNASAEHQVAVEAFAELDFQITNPGGPVEVGGLTNYEVRVKNSGSATDSDVTVQLLLPPGLELDSAEGETQTDGRGLVAFAPKSQLAPGGEVVHRIAARAVSPGSHIVKAVVVSGQQPHAVTKEESTLVYSDR